MKTVMCFGDSNTYGTPAMPDPDGWGRFGPAERWPGVMARLLGPAVAVIEEGLPGRTTLHDDPIEGADKNGLKALPMLLGSHRPVDLMIVKLGTNDLKSRFAVSAGDIAASVAVLVRAIQASPAGQDGRPPAVLVIAPPPIVETGWLGAHFTGGAAKSRHFGPAFAAMAARLDVPVLDAGPLVAVDPLDGIHLGVEAHVVLGQAVAERVRTLLG